MNKFREYGLSHKSDELKKLIMENPDSRQITLFSRQVACSVRVSFQIWM